MMRYKTLVSDKLDSVKNTLDVIVRGLEGRKISVEETIQKIKDANYITEQVIELVDKENEEISQR